MKGVKYLYDKKGKPLYVMIDLKHNGELWEDFQDMLVIEERRNDPIEDWEEVKAKLDPLRTNT